MAETIHERLRRLQGLAYVVALAVQARQEHGALVDPAERLRKVAQDVAVDLIDRARRRIVIGVQEADHASGGDDRRNRV